MKLSEVVVEICSSVKLSEVLVEILQFGCSEKLSEVLVEILQFSEAKLDRLFSEVDLAIVFADHCCG